MSIAACPTWAPAGLSRSAVAACQTLALAVAVVLALATGPLDAGPLRAGTAKVDISSPEAGPPRGPLYAKALVLTDGQTTAVLVTLDVVAIGEIGPIGNEFLPNLRARLQRELGLKPEGLLVNASHCHGVPARDVEDRTVAAVREAWGRLEPVRVGVGVGHEDRVSENRRLRLQSGREADVRHAYPLPADAEIAAVGPIDPAIGVLRLDRADGRPLALVYNFACHPIQGVPTGANTSDLTGFASQVIEDNLGPDTVALFVQGCGGDINPVRYKDTSQPRDAEPLGNLLGLSTLRAARAIECRPVDRLTLRPTRLALPRADLTERIFALETEQQRLLKALRGTSLNLKAFLPLAVRYGLDAEHPSDYAHRYLREAAVGREELRWLDAENRKQLALYIQNIQTMEELTRVGTNLALLRKHQAQNAAAGSRTVEVEVVGLRIGEFVLVTFPGELTVEIGLNIKRASPHPRTFVAGYTNGYIYYAPTARQLANVGGAQEDSDCILAPEWQAAFEQHVAALLGKLGGNAK